MNIVSIDTAGVCRIERSTIRQVGLTAGSFLFAAIGWWMINDSSVAAKHPSAPFFGWVCVVFSGICGMGWAYRLAFGAKWPITLSPEGLIDSRVSRSLVPWTSVNNVKAKVIGSTSLLGVDIDPNLKLELSLFGRALSAINAAMYGTRYWLVSADLKISAVRLHDLVHAYWHAHRPTETPSGFSPNSEIKGT